MHDFILQRHGNEVNLISFMGLMQALVSIIECDNGNRLKYIKSGEHTIVFMHRDHLIFVSVSSEKGKCPEQLYNELNFIYSQIVSVVTLSLINRIFKTHHNYDLRNKLSGTEKLIGNLVKRVKNDHGMLLNCLSVQPLAFEIREQIAKLIVQSIEASSVNYILFAILFYENKLVAVIRQKNKSLNPTDIHLLVNVITNSEALKASAFIWYPICLPNFNSSCVMNSYITLLDEKVCLVLLAGSCDHDQMMKLNDISSRIKDKMTSNSLLNTMHIKLNESEKALELVDISELRHFLFKDRVLLQYFVTDYSLPYTLSPEEQQRLFDIYQNLYHKLHRSFNSLRFVYICQKYETILGWFTTEFEIYATFSPITTKERIINAANRLLEYIIKNKNKLFITTMPTLNIKS